jgi:hypothetical protein
MDTIHDEEKVIKIYRRLEPSTSTRKFMEEQAKFNQHMEIAMNDVRNDIKSVCQTIELSNCQNKEEHKAIMNRLGRIEKFAFGILVIFALAALYFLFQKAGLPTP